MGVCSSRRRCLPCWLTPKWSDTTPHLTRILPDAHPKRVERGAAAVKAQDKPKANPDKVRDIKNWVYRILNVNPDIPISISQLTCKEPGCPPIETVIAIMTQPVKQYKIHKAVDEIDELDICNLY